jgi:quercetin dioxygenase-like cupin family protein
LQVKVVDRREANVGMCPVTADALVVDPQLGNPAAGAFLERRTVGFGTLAQTVIEFGPGGSARRFTGADEEVLFVLEGSGPLGLGGVVHALEPESGAYLEPGEEYELRNAGPGVLRLVAVRIPDPEPAPADRSARAVVRRLADQLAESATSEREFRIVADPGSGLRSATHFVGSIPATRAPDHFHTYDEVIHVVEGDGLLHVGGSHHAVTSGSSIQLPARTVHCLENTGRQVMRVVAVFRPAGSPAAAYYPDGTPAHPAAPSLSTA